ncbi:MAG: hypothetical protein IT372_32005 [Polyangiaceae bacterium]|nr:hypothetical protein [Polyangiaceae bacterium]
MRLPSPALAAALALAVCACPDAARAAACCGTGHGLGQRLGPSERAAASAAIRLTDRFGAWTSDRELVTSPAADHDRELAFELGWTVRAGRRVQLGVTVPLLATWKSLGGATSSGGGPGDVGASARVEVLEDGAASWAPSIAVTFGATLPTGRPVSASRDPLAADVTGLGAAQLRPGLSLEKTWGDWLYTTVSASAGFRTTTFSASGAEVELAPRMTFIAAAGPYWSSGLSITAGVLHEREAAPLFDGVRAAGADRERTALTVFAAYDLTHRWTALASLQVDVPAAWLGRNEPAVIAPYVGIRRMWSSFE